MGSDHVSGWSPVPGPGNAARAAAFALGVCALLLAGCGTAAGRITVHVEGMTRVLGIT